MTGIGEFHLTVCALSPVLLSFIVYFRKLSYFGLNILRYPWADRTGPCRQGPAGQDQPAPCPALGTCQGWPGMWGTGEQPCRSNSGAGDYGPRRLKWGSGLWAGTGTARDSLPLWEGTLTWGSSLHYALCSRPGSSITSVTAWVFPGLLSQNCICPHGQAWRELLAGYTALNPLQLALYFMRASSFSFLCKLNLQF